LIDRFVGFQIIQTVSAKQVSPDVVIAMSGISKIFVGEIVELALGVRDCLGETGALQPKHLREAYRLFGNQNRIASSTKSKPNSLF
jgi:transcription initiation factor TFIID subunit 11